jgi:class 3 adenylate cyclase
MLPLHVIKQLNDGVESIVEGFDVVTILFSDIVGFTTISSDLRPMQIVSLLNAMFSKFDALVHKNGVYKVETIGDCLMCVSGCPDEEDGHNAAVRMARMAQDMITCVENFESPIPGIKLQIRIGIHSGPIVAGVVGMKMPRWCLFGDTVNTASRMESTSVPMKVQVSASTATLLRNGSYATEFNLTPRGIVNIKGKGEMETFFMDVPGSINIQDV